MYGITSFAIVLKHNCHILFIPTCNSIFSQHFFPCVKTSIKLAVILQKIYKKSQKTNSRPKWFKTNFLLYRVYSVAKTHRMANFSLLFFERYLYSYSTLCISIINFQFIVLLFFIVCAISVKN